MNKLENQAAKRPKWTIRKKMILFLLLLLIIPSLIISIISYLVAKNETDALIHKNLENSVKLMNQSIKQLNEGVKNGVLTLEEAQEQIKTVMLGAKQADGKRPINKNIDLGENGYYYVLSENGDLLAHPSIEGQNLWENKTTDGFYYIQDVIKQGQKSEGGFTFYNWPLPNSEVEAPKITYALKAPEWNWIVVAGSYLQDYNGGQTKILLSTVITLISCIILGVIAAVLFSNHIARPIRLLASETDKVANGDLTSHELVVNNKDEIGELAASFAVMSEHLRTLVKRVMSSSEQVSTASEVLESNVQDTAQASKNIAESIQHITLGLETQAASTEQSSKAMEEMALGIQRIAETSTNAYDTSILSERQAKEGQVLIGQSVVRMQSVQQAVGDIAKVIETLNHRSQEIGQIVTAITDIANQTSLLALNAAIEAARAGDQGKGFAVVAAEVKKLAELSKDSSEQISQLVGLVQSDIQSASVLMNEGLIEVKHGVAEIEKTGAAFEKIVSATEEVVGQIQEASAAAEEMSASSEQIYASLQEMDRIAGQSANNAEEISASAEEQIASIDEILRSTVSLHQMAEELKQMIKQFQVEEEQS